MMQQQTIGAQLKAFANEMVSADTSDWRKRCELFSNTKTSRKLVLPKGVTRKQANAIAAAIEHRADIWIVPVTKVIVRICDGALNGGRFALTVKLEKPDNYINIPTA